MYATRILNMGTWRFVLVLDKETTRPSLCAPPGRRVCLMTHGSCTDEKALPKKPNMCTNREPTFGIVKLPRTSEPARRSARREPPTVTMREHAPNTEFAVAPPTVLLEAP
jgi:hypothetical protein